jgi:hypothetical protein
MLFFVKPLSVSLPLLYPVTVHLFSRGFTMLARSGGSPGTIILSSREELLSGASP